MIYSAENYPEEAKRSGYATRFTSYFFINENGEMTDLGIMDKDIKFGLDKVVIDALKIINRK